MRRWMPWFLSGALAGSLGLNLVLAGRSGPVSDGPALAALPEEIGLTPSQRAEILC